MSAYATERAREKIARLAGQGLDLPTFWQESSEVLARVVPHYMTPCWFTLDPASLLVTSHYQTEFMELPPEWLAHEYFDGRRPQAGRRRPVRARDLDAARGDRRRPEPQSRVEAISCTPTAATRNCSSPCARGRATPGACWVSTASRVEPLFARRRAPLPARGGALPGRGRPARAARRRGHRPRGTGGARAGRPQGGLECRVAHAGRRALAGRAARQRLGASRHRCLRRCWRWPVARCGRPSTRMRRARSRSRGCSRAAGRWLVLHGAALVADGARRVAVIIEPAHPARIASLLMAAYGLTEREQDVTRLVLQGNSTAEIADAPAVSCRRPSSSTSRASSTRRACAAGANSSARSSSPTTSHACATTSSGRSRVDRSAAGR